MRTTPEMLQEQKQREEETHRAVAGLEARRAAACTMLRALKEAEDLLAELRDGGAENPELDTVRSAIAAAEAAGITPEE